MRTVLAIYKRAARLLGSPLQPPNRNSVDSALVDGGSLQVRLYHHAILEARAGKIRVSEIGAEEVRSEKVNPPANRGVHFRVAELGLAQVRSGQINAR